MASHIVSDERLGEPETNRELFERLAQHGWLSVELAAPMGRMAGFRNVVVHGYGGVSLEIAKDIVEHRLADLTTFATAIRARLGKANIGVLPRPLMSGIRQTLP